MGEFTKLTTIIGLLLLSGFFSSSETALCSLNKIKLKRKEFRKNPVYQYTLQLLESPSKFLTTVLIGNELVNISISVIVAALVYSLVKGQIPDSILPFFSMAITVPAILLIGEIIPKTIAHKFPETVARLNSYPLYLFFITIEPLQRIFQVISGVFVRLFVKDLSKNPTDAISLDEDLFKSMIDIGRREGIIEQSERDLIHKVFHLDDIAISQIMTPRENIAALSIKTPGEEMLKFIEQHQHSRYPVYDQGFNNCIGFLYVKDLLNIKTNIKNGNNKTIEELLRPPYFVQADTKALAVFLQFQKKNIHIAIVHDTNKNIVGIVSLEDILEELFGEIRDEHDIEKEKKDV